MGVDKTYLVRSSWNLHLMKYCLFVFASRWPFTNPQLNSSRGCLSQKGIITFSHFLFPLRCFMTLESNATWNSRFQMSGTSKWCSCLKLGLLTSRDVLLLISVFPWQFFQGVCSDMYGCFTLCFKLRRWVYFRLKIVTKKTERIVLQYFVFLVLSNNELN